MDEFVLEDYLKQLSATDDIDDCPKVPIPTIQQNQNYLFVSYSHKDYKAVYADLAHLYCANVRFWYDKGLHVGREWEQEVEEHIKNPNCCGIIFYISTNMFLSESVLKEIEFTRTRKKAISSIKRIISASIFTRAAFQRSCTMRRTSGSEKGRHCWTQRRSVSLPLRFPTVPPTSMPTANSMWRS